MALAAALALSGCVELLGLGRFSVDDDDAGRDAAADRNDGGRDAARDACALATYYADLDDDGHGDPATSVEACRPMTGWVSDGDDCDDGANGVYPGAGELCDDIDQDCDGAIDEGLMGPIGSLIDVDTDVGTGTLQMSLVAHDNGTTVVWRTDAEDVVWASFYDRGGTAVAPAVMIQAVGTREPLGGRFARGGIDQVLVVWMDPTRIVARLCSAAGSCGTGRTVFMGDTTGLRRLRMTQLHDRMIVGWGAADGLHLISFDPVDGSTSAPILVPVVAGMVAAFDGGIATVDGDAPYSLVARVSATLVAGMVTSNRADLVRIHGESSLSFDDSDVFEWNVTDRCASLGRESCLPVLGIGGEGLTAMPSLVIGEYLIGTDSDGTRSTAQCTFIGTPVTDGPPSPGPCFDDWGVFALRDGLATVIDEVGADYALREVAIRSGTSGSPARSVSQLSPTTANITGFAMRGAHGAVIALNGSAPRRLSMLRIGCAP